MMKKSRGKYCGIKRRIKYCILFFIFRVILHNRIISFGIQLWFFFFNGVYDTFIHCKTFFVRGVKTIFNPLAFFREFSLKLLSSSSNWKTLSRFIFDCDVKFCKNIDKFRRKYLLLNVSANEC